jgi:ABC-type transport system substrate-binding protein
MSRILMPIITAALLVSFSLAQPPRKEDEDPKAKPVKPIDIESFPTEKEKVVSKMPEGPGVKPGSGTLVVGVRALPDMLSPSRAHTDPENWSLDLLFEELMRPVNSAAGISYVRSLASDITVEPNGRTFVIDPQAKWSDGSPILATDVLTTLEKLKVAGRADAFGDASSDAPRRVRLSLRFPHPDPPSLFTFKLQPANRLDDEAFARAPLGSGPFTYAGAKTQGGRDYAIFTSNPRYAQRSSRQGRPLLREVRFLASPEPLEDVRRGLADMAIEERTQALFLNAPPNPRLEIALGNDVHVITVPSRRIYYLAFNPLKMALAGDVGRPLRRAVAFGIRRELILDDVWRVKDHPWHKALTGPFPSGTWPCDPESPTLDDESLARAGLREAKLPPERLILMFDSDDPTAKKACDKIVAQLQELSVGIDAKGYASAEYRRALAEKGYDLAYRYFDFKDDWFDPDLLFTPANGGLVGAGAGMARLEALLQRGATRCDYVALRDLRRALHREFREVMPFVPLWSPDIHIVLRRTVEPYPAADRIDPHAPFVDIDRWKLGR